VVNGQAGRRPWPVASPAKANAAGSSRRDGRKYDKAADFDLPNATEAALAFDGDVPYCLQRRDGKPSSAQLGTSRPPYMECW
jgi:hypothetical protein